MSIKVKICGLTCAEAVAAAVEAGADALGFVFAESQRRLSVDQALLLSEGLPMNLARVAVMRHPSAAQVEDVLEGFRPDFLQTDSLDFSAISLLGPCRPLPVFRDAEILPERVPYLMLYEGKDSGSGQVADWGVASRLAGQTRLILAGGLSIANVGEAIATVRPYGVDVSSGVEHAPGRKDPEKIFSFVAAARAAADSIETLNTHFGEKTDDGTSRPTG
ncbi:MAG: phosphoribosylanthranilate isomerase [Gammaproteobacteria bacterium]